MSHDDLGTFDILDDEDFHEEGGAIIIDESEQPGLARKQRQGIRRMIDDVLEERRLRAVLKGYDDSYQNLDAMIDSTVAD